jgi:acyltransferase
LLSPSARSQPLVAEYWRARGFTAPLFMVVAGWALALWASRSRARGIPLVVARLPRVLLLLAVGYGLRLPGWNWSGFLAGDRHVWEHFLAFDALHVIAAGALVAVVAVSLSLRRRELGLTFVLLAVATTALGMSEHATTWPPRTLASLALAQAVGGTSPFPVFPWVTYVFAGAAVRFLASDGPGPRAVSLAGIGAALVVAAHVHGMDHLLPHHPVLLASRLGIVLVALAVLEWLPAPGAALLVPLGRHSLGIYAMHVAVIYGWLNVTGLSGTIGQRLAPGEAALVAVAVLAATLAAALVLREASHAALGALRRASVNAGVRQRPPAPPQWTEQEMQGS